MKILLNKLLLNKALLFFINGILLSSCFYFKTESNYEDALFASIVDKINLEADQNDNIDSFFFAAMHMTHTLEYNRQAIFSGRTLKSLKADFFRPATIDLMTGNGACGSYTTVLARILKAGGYQVRIAQMYVNGKKGGHMVVEAKKRSNWLVLDPLLEQYFKKPDGTLASFRDVQQNWTYYQQQTHQNYVPSYRYEDVQYTNWEKIKVVGPIVKKIFILLFGKETTNEIAIRSYILRKYQLLYLFSLIAFIGSCILIVISFRRNKYTYN